MLRAAIVQLTSSDDPAANMPRTEALVRDAAKGGAELIATPEVTNIVSMSRARQREMLRSEAEDPTLARLRAVAVEMGVWVLIGSLALSGESPDGRFVNRSFLLGPDGGIVARYDKIHMFDAAPGAGEAYRESAGYRPGKAATLARTPWGGLGLTICYDLRFPELYLRLARAGARLIAIPSAFTRPTGAAHWEPLLRARAIETGCYVLAPAQCGTHPAAEGRSRETWGHSMIVAPWGEVSVMGETAGVLFADLDMAAVDAARARVPSLSGARVFHGP
ncbi:carbon-nitrogen hydrolase family protein [Pikeienuella piscinae]|uniref:Carbon-nitrogen hydrolase family protein n=2 Tax=Pikeienuella piscinae TaxID=2748098 RepID=A0A7M3T764_9RHOB|nr:carbon-nitrogen hydrolase family protein [Pikeienuella piscinae]QIE57845.1 carbon-nitrogen hydrolase family protein [Pikeienuella piscinae]